MRPAIKPCGLKVKYHEHCACLREGEIKGLLRAKRYADVLARKLHKDGYYILVSGWCRSEAAKLKAPKRGREGA